MATSTIHYNVMMYLRKRPKCYLVSPMTTSLTTSTTALRWTKFLIFSSILLVIMNPHTRKHRANSGCSTPNQPTSTTNISFLAFLLNQRFLWLCGLGQRLVQDKNLRITQPSKESRCILQTLVSSLSETVWQLLPGLGWMGLTGVKCRLSVEGLEAERDRH